jgi:hypothetical protein
MIKQFCLILPLVGLLFFTTESFGQVKFKPGFVVLNNNDTLRGLLYYDMVGPYETPKDLKFKSDVKAKKSSLSPKEVRGFMLDGDWHVSNTYNGSLGKRTVFMRVILEGAIVSLYTFDVSHDPAGKSEIKLLEKKNGEQLLVGMNGPELGLKKKLLDFFAEAPEVCERINNDIYGRYDLDKMAAQYNEAVKQ